MTPPQTLCAALSLAGMGLRVVPVTWAENGVCSCPGGNACDAAGKHPILKRWQHLATTNPQTIWAWWDEHPKANLGIVTGRKSGVWALDVDTRSGGDDALHDLELSYSALPATWEVQSGGGGRHLLFAYPGDRLIANSAGELGEGLDVRGEGGVVVAPPSVHASGRRYQWSVDGDPSETQLATAPEWLLALLKERKTKAKRDMASGGPIPQSKRHDTLVYLAGRMRWAGFSLAAIEAALEVENRTRCEPPFDPNENGGIESIVKSSAAWQAGPTWAADLASYISDPQHGPHERSVLATLVRYSNMNGEAWPGYDTLAREARVSRSGLAGVIRRLEATGHVSVTRARSGNRYRLTDPSQG